MFKKLRELLGFIFLISCSLAQAGSIYDTPTTFVGPTGKGKFTHLFTPNTAFSVLGEAGPRNYRVGGTLGWLVDVNQRLKISGEYLTQDIEYSFFNGNTREWVQQGAVGGQYQYDLSQNRFLPQFNLKAGYSHAPSKQLYSIAIPSINILSQVQYTTYDRRIAGSNAGYVSPGLSIQPWQSGRVGVDLNYDDVEYDRIYFYNEHAQGFGGSANLIQSLGPNTELGVSVGIREPFNAYQANLAYNLPNHPDWTVGVDGNYVEGKHCLPNTYNVGISVSYALLEGETAPVNSLEKDPPIHPGNSVLTSWTADPAIYVPQVLAIADEGIIIPQVLCNAPAVVGTIPTQTITGPSTVNTAPVFSGTTPFTFSVSFSGVNVPPQTTVTIDPSTGVVSINPFSTGSSYSFNVTVTATNACGSTPTTFLVNFNDIS